MRDVGDQSDSESAGDDPLDALLRQAKWPVAGDGRVDRLAQRWNVAWKGRCRRERIVKQAWAAAAALLIGAGVAWIVGRREFPPIVEPSVPSPSVAEKPRPDEVRPKETAIVGREPNFHERAVITAWRQSAQRRTEYVRDEQVEAAIDRLRYEPDVTVSEAARQLLGPKRAHYERRLVENARFFDGPRRHAALELLEFVGTPRCADDLVALIRREADAELAAAVLVRVVSPEQCGRRALNEPNPQARRTILAALLARGDAAGVHAFLRCVLIPKLHDDTLVAAAECRRPPVELLFRELDSAYRPRALAAARVLGRIDDAEVIWRLTKMVRSEPARWPAMAALLSSDEPEAVELVEHARRTWPLAATVQVAQAELQSRFFEVNASL